MSSSSDLGEPRILTPAELLPACCDKQSNLAEAMRNLTLQPRVVADERANDGSIGMMRRMALDMHVPTRASHIR